MSTRAKYSGAVGTIIDGRLRDLQEHRDLEYPVFARDVGTASPQELLRVSEVSYVSLCISVTNGCLFTPRWWVGIHYLTLMDNSKD